MKFYNTISITTFKRKEIIQMEEREKEKKKESNERKKIKERKEEKKFEGQSTK